MTAGIAATNELTAAEPASHSSRAIGSYNPAFDGLRWIAMAVMLAFHAGFSWGQGAAFGLSQFFTLSGFLITSLLLRGRDAAGRLDLKRFWTRRFRRLMPAAMMTLAGIVVFATWFADGSQLAKLPGQVTSALFYVVNWYFVFTDQSYVAQFASPSPVVHFWSLAVEEQFYVFMPLILLVVLRRTSSLKTLGIFFSACAVASAAWMITLYHLGASIDRLYYGTDTRAAEFLVGAALACFVMHRPIVVTPRVRTGLTAASVVVFAITVYLWTSVPLDSLWLYQGGFFAFSLLTATLMTALYVRTGPLATIFSWAPFAALGRITYGIYLFQWPIFLWLDEERTGLSRWPLLVLQLALILGLSTASYHLIELPIRAGRMLPDRKALLVAPSLAAAICAGVFVVSARGPGDPLAPLAEISSDAPPALAPSRPLEVLTIADPGGQGLVSELTEQGSREGVATVTTGPSFGCPPAPAPTRGCPSWHTAWQQAIDEVDPDVVVLAVTVWRPEDIAAASGLGADAPNDELTRWTEATMLEGIDILTSRGATVVWAPYLTTDLLGHIRWTEEPFGNVMMRLPAIRPDVLRVPLVRGGAVGSAVDPSFDTASADALLVELEPLERRDEAGVRVLVVGDSLAASLGVGLDRWAQETGAANVWTAALLGCGFVYEGEIKFPGTNGDVPIPPHCMGVEDGWRRQIDEFDPDVVVVLTTLWDIAPRHLPEWDGHLRPGDAAFDAFLLDRYRTALGIFTSRGARVVWFDGLCWGGEVGTSIAHLNDVILPQLQQEHPDQMEIYGFADLVCQDGEIPDELGGVADPFPDDVHLSPDAAHWVATQIAPVLTR